MTGLLRAATLGVALVGAVGCGDPEPLLVAGHYEGLVDVVGPTGFNPNQRSRRTEEASAEITQQEGVFAGSLEVGRRSYTVRGEPVEGTADEFEARFHEPPSDCSIVVSGTVQFEFSEAPRVLHMKGTLSGSDCVTSWTLFLNLTNPRPETASSRRGIVEPS